MAVTSNPQNIVNTPTQHQLIHKQLTEVGFDREMNVEHHPPNTHHPEHTLKVRNISAVSDLVLIKISFVQMKNLFCRGPTSDLVEHFKTPEGLLLLSEYAYRF